MANLSRRSESVAVFSALLAESHSAAGLLGTRLYVQLAVQDVYEASSAPLQLAVAEEPTAANAIPTHEPYIYKYPAALLISQRPLLMVAHTRLSQLSVCMEPM